MSTASQAIFISYAREDAVAADRIAEALRSHGLEVWFDQNELRGGDSWDQKLRGQIRTCSLLIPIVSANTQARGEGYFRREWKLAAERTHDIAAGIPFIVPVVIDDTAESAALVPEEFMRVQWTRLSQGRTTPEFAAQVKRLLEAPRGAVSPKMEPGRSRPGERGEGAAAPRNAAEAPRRRVRTSIWIAVIAVVAIAIAALLAVDKRPRPAQVTAEKPALAAAERSIAVLPFENLSAEPDSAFFADGIHDEVLTAVQKVSALSKVINRTSVLQYADVKKRDLREIGAKLGVATVLEGTVRRMGSRVRVGVQLVEVATSRQLWADSYDKELTDVFAIQSAIAREIATALRTTLTDGERAALDQQPTQNADAYRLYLQARAMMRDIGAPRATHREKIEGAISLYEQAAAADPRFALPHVELTRCYGYKYWFGFFNPTPESARRAEASAARVRELMPEASEARLAAGMAAYFCRHNWSEALAQFRAAEAGLPNSADAIRFGAFSLRRLGQLSETITALRRAVVVDPQDIFGWDTFSESLLMAQRYPDVIRAVDEMTARGLTSEMSSAIRAYAQLVLDGDVERYRRVVRPLRGTLVTGFVPELGWLGDMFARDFAAVEEYFARSSGFISGPASVVAGPVAHHRALVAFRQGDRERARKLAAEARPFFENGNWQPRQKAIAAAELALSCALVGEREHARTEMQRSRALQEKLPDALVQAALHYLWAATDVVLGDREAALGELRQAAQGLSQTDFVPALAHLDPLWDSLKSDPRFAEILKSAKPL
jgi:TolB-like protein